MSSRTTRSGRPKKGVTDEDRFWSGINKTDSCWVWTRSTRAGYGRMNWRGSKGTAVHRISWEMNNGPIPDDLVVDHICFNRLCVRPDHLQLLTRGANAARKSPEALLELRSRPKPVACPHGHDYTTENIGVTKQGKRFCRECSRIRTRRNKARRQEAA